MRFDTFVDPADAAVASADGDSLRGRLGLSLDHQTSWDRANGDTARTHHYGIANLDHELLDGSRVAVAGTPLRHRDHRLWGELGLGGSLGLGKRLTIYGEVAGSTALDSFGDGHSLKGTAGLRLAF